MSAAEHPTERALSFARLPDRIDGWRVLSLGAGGAGESYLTSLGAAELVALDEPSEDAGLEAGAFDLAICGSGLETDAHPLATYAWVRRAIKPEGVLIAGSRVLSDPTKSQYARFVPASESSAASCWLPGRLAFRWMVEVSGFDVGGWLGDAGDEQGDRPVYLQAKAADRLPPLDLDRQPISRS
jgi:hypothetical protein